MNRVDRLLGILLLLQSRRVVTAEEMARHFELSVRTVYRDLAALAEVGVPIVAEAGVGYALMKGYHLPPVNFAISEANALATGGLLIEQLTDSSTRMQMQSALAKIRAVLPRTQQDRILRLQQSMATTANVPAPPQADLGLLQQALAEQRVATFRYQSTTQPHSTQRVVEPMGLLRYLERWHLIAWCRTRNGYRDFRIDRMRDLILTNQTFTPRPEFSLANYIQQMPQPTLRAKILFTPGAADQAKREWWLGITEERVTKAGVLLTLAAVEWERLVGWLLSFGSEATVVTPAELKGQLVKAAQALAVHHGKKPKHS